MKNEEFTFLKEKKAKMTLNKKTSGTSVWGTRCFKYRKALR